MNSPNCPCCGANNFTEIFDFKGIPQTGIFNTEPSDLINTNDLIFEICLDCALVRQSNLQLKKNYLTVDRSTALQFPKNVSDLIGQIKKFNIQASDLIIEIGSNDGLFLDCLKKASFQNLIGIEPSEELSNHAREKGHDVLTSYFDSQLVPKILNKYGIPKLIICRHTLEHIADPRSFIKAIHECFKNTDGVLLLEVPDGSAIPDLFNIYELWDEHLFYFSKHNLSYLLESCGFNIQEVMVSPHLETRNIITFSKANINHSSEMNRDPLDHKYVKKWVNLPLRWDAFVERLIEEIKKMPHPICAIGGSHSQTNFLNYSKLHSYIDYLIDDDAFKIGKYAPLIKRDTKIISSNFFRSDIKSGTIIKIGFGYASWTNSLCNHANEIHLNILDPREHI